MGLLGSLFNKLENAYLEQYGIKTPYDAIKFFDRLVSSDMENQEKIKLAKQVVSWLKKTELSGERYADSARDVLRKLREQDQFILGYKHFFRDNRINL